MRAARVVDRAVHVMLSFRTPRLVWVKRNRNNRVATRISSDAGAEPLNAHGLIVVRRRLGRVPVTPSTTVADVLPGRLAREGR